MYKQNIKILRVPGASKIKVSSPYITIPRLSVVITADCTLKQGLFDIKYRGGRELLLFP